MKERNMCNIVISLYSTNKSASNANGEATVNTPVRTEIDPQTPHTYFQRIFSYTQVLYKL